MKQKMVESAPVTMEDLEVLEQQQHQEIMSALKSRAPTPVIRIDDSPEKNREKEKSLSLSPGNKNRMCDHNLIMTTILFDHYICSSSSTHKLSQLLDLEAVKAKAKAQE